MTLQHKVKNKTMEYFSGSVYLYRIRCTCGDCLGGWTPEQAEKEFEKHKKCVKEWK